MAVEDGDVADTADEFAFCRLCDLGRNFFFSFFEFAEFYFDEFVILKRQINRGDKAIGYAFGTDNYLRLEMMRLRAQIFFC